MPIPQVTENPPTVAELEEWWWTSFFLDVRVLKKKLFKEEDDDATVRIRIDGGLESNMELDTSASIVESIHWP